MSAFVADTHAVIWYILNQDALSSSAREAFATASASGDPVYLSAISVVEIHYLVEKGKFTSTFVDRFDEALSSADAALVVTPLTLEIARTLSQIPRSSIPEMPDRIIAATALYLNLPLITRDRKIQASTITTVW